MKKALLNYFFEPIGARAFSTLRLRNARIYRVYLAFWGFLVRSSHRHQQV